MSSNIVNQIPYLRTSRNYPEDLTQLTVEVNKSYVDIANAVNARTIGLFPTNRPAITGESWFISKNQRQQTLRQVYPITSIAPFNHGINFDEVSTFTVIRAIGYDNTSLGSPYYYPIPYVSTIAASGYSIYVNTTQVIITPVGVVPNFNSGIVILEWMSDV